MRNITEKDIQDLLLKCHNNKNYRACIILGTLTEVKDFLRAMGDDAQDWIVKKTLRRIEFKNGSFIDVLPAKSATHSLRGARYHYLIQDNVLPKEVAEIITSSFLIPYYEDDEDILCETDENILANFLDEFNIKN